MQGLRLRRLDDGQTRRARAGRGGRLLGDRVHARRLPSCLYATKSAQNPAGRLVCCERPGRAIDAGPRWNRQHDQLLAAMDGEWRSIEPGILSPASRLSSSRMCDGSSRSALASVKAPEFFVPAFFAAPSWSPDGGRISVTVHNGSTGDAVLATIDARSGARQDFSRRFRDATFTSWLPDGSGILFVADQADEFREYPRKVWFQPYPRGEPHRVTPDLLEYRNVSVRADGEAFVSVGLDAAYTLWRIPLQRRQPAADGIRALRRAARRRAAAGRPHDRQLG